MNKDKLSAEINNILVSNGFYDENSPTNALGTFSNLVNVSNLVTSSYIASFCVGVGGGSFDFEPLNDVAISSSVFRGTGGISIGVGEGVVSYILTEDGDFLITEDGNNLIQ